ncbi:MAG: GH92 family glycosyl hydrolase [Clostridia bacterium]|nr:GH92 family glycosyl hydrolase [Clostridia bacterium]
MSLSEYIDPTIGNVGDEDSDYSHGGGKTHPGACLPGGLVQLCADTVTGGDNGTGYNYCQNTIEGFSFNRMSGIGWYGDLGNLQIMPVTGDTDLRSGTNEFWPLIKGKEGWKSSFTHEKEKASAGFYSVELDRYDIFARATVTPHCGVLEFNYKSTHDNRIIFNFPRRIGGKADNVRVSILDSTHLEGTLEFSPKGGGFGHGHGKVEYKLHFVCELSAPYKTARFFSQEEYIGFEPCAEGDDIGLVLGFGDEKSVTVKTAISYVDLDGARKNFAEVHGRAFDEIYAQAVCAWEDALSCAIIETENETDKTLFYTCLYHTLLDPRSCADADGRYMAADGNIRTDTDYIQRTVFSGWDVYRSEFPLLTLIAPETVNDEVNSLISLAEARNSSYPRWEVLGINSDCMVGDPAIIVIADAYIKGIRNYDVGKAYEYAKASALGPETLYGKPFTCLRQKCDFLNKTGFKPGLLSVTLEELLANFTLSELAAALGKSEDAEFFADTARKYPVNYNPDTGFMGPKHEDGSFMPLDEFEYDTDGCVESNIYQQSWFVPYDVEGLSELFGRERFVELLEKFFEKADFSRLWNDDYNHSNEPCHNLTHYFNILGMPEKTQYWTRRVQKEAYRLGAFGFCGNEDVGQLSAWYVLSALGFAQVCPGVPVYEINSPLFKACKFRLDKKYHSCKVSDTFTVECDKDPLDYPYIEEIYLNGERLEGTGITYDEITAGGRLEFVMKKQCL